MLLREQASKGLLFSSFLFRNDLFAEKDLRHFWEEKFGPSFAFHPKNNPLNQYYSNEMGNALSRVFFLTSSFYSREKLLTTKLESLGWESSWSENGQRRINIDIGFLSAENFILATTKNYSHRIFLGQDIYADLTYYFHSGELQTLPWTYPDYLDSEKIEFITWGRSYLLQNKTINAASRQR